MKTIKLSILAAAALCAGLLTAPAHADIKWSGASANGTELQGRNYNGRNYQGRNYNGAAVHGDALDELVATQVVAVTLASGKTVFLR